MLIIGIDENGLGPLLGPLVVTAVAFEAEEYDRDAFWRIGREYMLADDSKKIFISFIRVEKPPTSRIQVPLFQNYVQLGYRYF